MGARQRDRQSGRIYFGAYNGSVYCLDAKTGREVWRHPLCEWVGSSPLVLLQHGTLAIGLEYARPRAGGSVCELSLQIFRLVMKACGIYITCLKIWCHRTIFI